MIRTPVRLFLLGFILIVATAAVVRTHEASAARVAGHVAAQRAAHAVPMSNGWTFQGCWRYETHLQCFDIFTDSSGNWFICKPCGTTGNPSPGKCDPISPETLAGGLWCS